MKATLHYESQITTASEILLDRCMDQAAAAIEAEDYEALQRFMDRGERLMNFIDNNRDKLKRSNKHEHPR